MTDGPDFPTDQEPEPPLAGLDAERPLPPELRARLEAALGAAVAGGLPVPADGEPLDAPRPLPEPLRARLESALLAEAAASTDSTVIPLERKRRKVVAWWSAVAAVLVLLLGVAGLANIGADGSGKVEVANAPTTTTAETPATLPSEAGVSPEVPPTAPLTPASTATTRNSRPPVRPSPTTTVPLPVAGPPQTTPTTTPAPASTQPAPAESGRGPAPPFYDSTSPSGDAANPPAMTSQPASPGSGQQGAAPDEGQKSNSPATTSAGPALRVGIVAGDAAQEAGFRAYVNRLNQNGGVAGHAIELVAVGPGSPAANTVATVNLGLQPVAGSGGAPSWATGPLLETLTATESLLRGDGAVFSFASPPERQGHLAADALFPSNAAPGTRAVIYVPATPGPLRDVVPEAIKTVLQERGVTADVVIYDPDAHKPLTPADAAFVSLDPATAKAWVAEAKSANYRPAAGVAGIYSLFDEALLADLPEGARVVSPYVVPTGTEGQAIRSEAGGTSASVLHGWATAKSLAAAIWRTGADTAAEVQAALEGLAGWSSGLAPAYETRPGTRSRTPEGVVFRVQSQAFFPDGGFRRDPR
jgi:hypothetical protein